MSAPPPLAVRTAGRPGHTHRPTEDRVSRLPSAVVLLDGATQAFPLDRDGGWYADTLGRRLADGLTQEPGADLGRLLESSIAQIVARHDLHPGAAPSATVAIARWTSSTLDVLVLCDSPVIVKLASGDVVQVRDDRLAQALSRLTARPAGPRDMSNPQWLHRLEGIERLRNSPDGFWVASATPEAAREATVRSFPLNDVQAVALATDGVAAGVDKYGQPGSWAEALDIAIADPAQLVELVHSTENTDPDCTAWPRSKQHDDKCIAIITWDHEASDGSSLLPRR